MPRMHRPTILTALSGLPPLLLTLAFSFAVVTTTSSRWVTRRDYNVDSNRQQNLKGHLYRSPFIRCLILPEVPGAIDAEPTYLPAECIASTNPGGTCYPTGGDTPLLCSALTLTGQLLIAGCVLLGLAAILAVALFTHDLLAPSCAATQQPYRPTRLRHHHRRRSADEPSPPTSTLPCWHPCKIFKSSAPVLLLLLLSIAGAVCMVIAHWLGAWALLAQQLPNALFADPGSPDFLGAWYADSGLRYGAASWTLAGFGAVMVGLL